MCCCTLVLLSAFQCFAFVGEGYQRWIKIDRLDVTCFIISLFNAQHVSDVNTSIFRSLRLICWVISWVVLLWYDVCWCYVVAWLGWFVFRMQAEALLQPAFGYYTTPPQPNHTVKPTHIVPEQYNTWNNSTISRKLLRMDVLTSETCRSTSASASIRIPLHPSQTLYPSVCTLVCFESQMNELISVKFDI